MSLKMDATAKDGSIAFLHCVGPTCDMAECTEVAKTILSFGGVYALSGTKGFASQAALIAKLAGIEKTHCQRRVLSAQPSNTETTLLELASSVPLSPVPKQEPFAEPDVLSDYHHMFVKFQVK